MTTFYSVSAPLGAAKTTSAILFIGERGIPANQRFIIAQPSILLIEQSLADLKARYPDISATAIHSDNCGNVQAEIARHTKETSSPEVLLITHAALMDSPYVHNKNSWHLIVDEAPSSIYNETFNLHRNHTVLLPALESAPYNLKYSRLVAGDDALLKVIAENKKNDMVDRHFQSLCRHLKSNNWILFVITEQFERFKNGNVDDGQLDVFGTLDASVFYGFSTVTIMAANLEKTLVHKMLVNAGISFLPHKGIFRKLRFTEHQNGHLLTIHYALNQGWSKRKRDKVIDIDGEKMKVNEAIIKEAMFIVDDEEFLYQINKDLNINNPFAGYKNGIQLPHSPHGLNCFQHIHSAVVLSALNPTPAMTMFLNEIADVDSEALNTAIYHEATYQAAGRISLRNMDDLTPKHLFVADRETAEAIAELYPNATTRQLAIGSSLPQNRANGRPKIHESDKHRKRDMRTREKDDLLAGLTSINRIAQLSQDGNTKEESLKVFPSCGLIRERSLFGGHIIPHKYADHDEDWSGSDFNDMADTFRALHLREVNKEDAILISPSVFEQKAGVETNRGRENVKAVFGVFLDNDGGGITWQDFKDIFPTTTMIIYNTPSSTPGLPRYRVVLPTTHAMTAAVYFKVLANIRNILHHKGYYDKNQLKKREKAGTAKPTDKDHGFDASKFFPESMFYLPVQAVAGPDASFFEVFNGERRKPINPFTIVDRSLVWDEPEPAQKPVILPPAPIPTESKDPRLARVRELLNAEQHKPMEKLRDTALTNWRNHMKGEGNAEFWKLASSLKRSGLNDARLKQTLYNEATYSNSTNERRNSIPYIIKRLDNS